MSAVDLAAGLSAQAVAQLAEAIDRHAVLVFHGQLLDDDRLLVLGRLFGSIEAPRNHRVERRLKHAELADISNLDACNQLRARDDHRRLDARGNQLWHSDASFRQVSGALSMLFAHVVPPLGGETEFADLRAGYDLLSQPMQAKIEDLVCEHSIFHSRGQLGHKDQAPFTTTTPSRSRSARPCRLPITGWYACIQAPSARRSTWAPTPPTSSAGPCRMGGSCYAT
ncbi:MAG: TauD/TfdA family dioxygenase [Hyphomicrobiaceae bacterium]|nr:TauD/TfdA family dioxygenase [Hyphomicrobiaceae bacterium]